MITSPFINLQPYVVMQAYLTAAAQAAEAVSGTPVAARHPSTDLAPATYLHDPSASLDYGFDWDDWLASGDSISQSEWTVPSGLTKVADRIVGTIASVDISGGTVGTEYEIVNRIASAQGRIDDRTIILRCRNR